jgi:hypothetical protein
MDDPAFCINPFSLSLQAYPNVGGLGRLRADLAPGFFSVAMRQKIAVAAFLEHSNQPLSHTRHEADEPPSPKKVDSLQFSQTGLCHVCSNITHTGLWCGAGMFPHPKGPQAV